jgi:alpha-beta hydrolase superfamily lysophospholipase
MSLHTDRGTLGRTRTRGPVLYFSRVAPAEALRATVGIVPGYADYADRYEHVQRAWAEKGIASVAIDLRGHGHAEGSRGACRHFDEYLDDVDELFAKIGSPEHPVFLFGHSFGGLVSSAWAEREPRRQRALLLSNPYMKLAFEPPRAKVIVGKLASAALPFLGVPAGIKGHQLTHDAARAKAYDDDPLVFKNANARWFTECEAAQGRVRAGAKSFELPLYVVLGTADRVVAGGREFFDAAASKDKKLDVREGLLHEVLNEPEWPDIAGAMADWMLSHA